MIAAQAGLAHDLLEGDVGGTRHRSQQRAAGDAVGIARGLQKHLQIGALHHRRSGRGRRARRTAPERWPRTGIAAAAACTARGWSAPSARPASPARRRNSFRASRRTSASWGVGNSRLRGSQHPAPVSSSVTQWPSVVNTRSAMLAAAALVKVMQRIFSGATPAEQQADHALHQHMGLARAGIGGHERGRRRDRTRAPAVSRTFIGIDAGGLHHSSIPRPPAADHSLIRARSS